MSLVSLTVTASAKFRTSSWSGVLGDSGSLQITSASVLGDPSSLGWSTILRMAEMKTPMRPRLYAGEALLLLLLLLDDDEVEGLPGEVLDAAGGAGGGASAELPDVCGRLESPEDDLPIPDREDVCVEDDVIETGGAGRGVRAGADGATVDPGSPADIN